jgi:hypothetical protein
VTYAPPNTLGRRFTPKRADGVPAAEGESPFGRVGRGVGSKLQQWASVESSRIGRNHS